MSKKDYNAVLREFARLVREKSCNPYKGKLKTGVDLGTANLVLAVTDENGAPVAGASCPSYAVRDGIVVDYIGAVEALRGLKAELEERMNLSLTCASTAIPPCILEGNAKVISNVVEAADFALSHVIDEPTAAARVLGVRNGAVVDVGGGTTGISILKDGKVIFTDDEATGGTHMTLVLAGAYGISFEEAEELKKDPEKSGEVFSVVRPVVEKMASIITRCLKQCDTDEIYIVGGACSFEQFEEIFHKETGKKILKPAEPLFVTPLGIAQSSEAFLPA